MNVLGAIVAGLIGTVAITLVMSIAPQMGTPKMDMVGMLGSMFDKDGNRTLGLAIHLMMGAVFAVIYALVWSSGIIAVSVVSGILLGIVHWLIVGTTMAMMPTMHAGIQAGAVAEPGLYMTKSSGVLGFVGGLMGHIIIGLVVALVYRLFI